MASEAQDSHRKHRRASSSDDEAEKSSKRHKHRHHHRHHRHRHGSKKREGDVKPAVDDIEAPLAAVLLSSSGANSSRPDEDVEEGEILEEEGVGGHDDGVLKTTAGSDAESGEIEALGVRDQSDNRNLVCSECPVLSSGFSLVGPLLAVWSLKRVWNLEIRIFNCFWVVFMNSLIDWFSNLYSFSFSFRLLGIQIVETFGNVFNCCSVDKISLPFYAFWTV